MESFIVSYARTPIGSFQGSLSSLTAVELGSIAIRETLRRSGNYINDVEEVIFGNVLSAGLGQAPARQASILAGLPNSVECTTINKVCGSGMKSIMLADQAIRCGDANFIISGGVKDSLHGFYLMEKLGASCVYAQAKAFLEKGREGFPALRTFVENQLRGLALSQAFLRVKN